MRWARPLILALALLASGCVVGPSYQAPAPLGPSSGAFSATLPATAGSADQPPPDWWRLYDDPALNALVQDALTHNTSLEVAAANLAQARAALSLARAGRYPVTTISTSGQYGVPSNAAAGAAGRGRTATPAAFYAVGLDASYEIDLFGRIRRAVEAARADLEAQVAAEDVTRISVAGETTRAYLNACAYAEELAAAKQSVDIVRQTYDLTVTQARFGVASGFDLARARQLVAQTTATLPGYESQRRAALFELAVLTGRPPEEISRAADACTSAPRLTTVIPIGDVQGLFRRRPDVRQAERRLAGNFARIGVATANLFPTVSIGGFGQTASGSLGGLTSLRALSYGVGPSLSWAFPDILVALAQVREARAAASASYASFEGSVLQALQDTEEAVTSYGAELDRHASLVTSRDQSRIAFGLAQVQYQNGAASLLDLLTAQTSLVDASQALASSDQALASDQVTLFKALGGGWGQAPTLRALPLRDAKSGKVIEVR